MRTSPEGRWLSAAGWGQPALRIVGRCHDGRGAKNFSQFLHCCMGKGNREGNGTGAGGHR